MNSSDLEKALDDAEEFKENHAELFERLAEGPTAASAVDRLTLKNCLSERTVGEFKFVLQGCAWSKEPVNERPTLPRVPKKASASKKLAFGLAMHKAIKQLRDETLARLGINYLGIGGPLNSPESDITAEMAKRIDPALFNESESASE